MVTLNLVTSTPVILLIMTRIKYARRIIARPATAEVNIFLAPSTLLGSPPDVINLKPPTRSRTKNTKPAKPKTYLIRF